MIFADLFSGTENKSANPASGAVMRKAGMTYIGTEPDKYEKNGIVHDAARYQITREDWERSNS